MNGPAGRARALLADLGVPILQHIEWTTDGPVWRPELRDTPRSTTRRTSELTDILDAIDPTRNTDIIVSMIRPEDGKTDQDNRGLTAASFGTADCALGRCLLGFENRCGRPTHIIFETQKPEKETSDQLAI